MLSCVDLSDRLLILFTPSIKVRLHIPLISRSHQFLDVLGTHSFAASIGSFNFKVILFADCLDFLVLGLQICKLHRLHLDRIGLLI